MFFRKQELIITYDTAIQASIRNVLEKENIDYFINPFLTSWSINRCQPEYKIYVKKCDYERANRIVRKLLQDK